MSIVDVSPTVPAPRRVRRWQASDLLSRWMVPAALLALSITTVATVVRADDVRDVPADVAAAEATMLTRVNALRAEHGLASLRSDPELRRVADRWTVAMAGQGRISHNPNLGDDVHGPWRLLGENVGSGGDPVAVMDGLIDSPEHLRNLLDPTFDLVAVTMREVDGTWFVTQDFADVPTGARLAVPSGDVPDLLLEQNGDVAA